MDFNIRRAKPGEAVELNEITNRSKAHWPYDQTFMDIVRSHTHITENDIATWPVIVTTKGEQICGYASIATVRSNNMLDQMWIDPPFIGKGLGSLLFLECIRVSKGMGWDKFQIASDPHAESFYLKMGAVRIGDWDSKIFAGLKLPLLEYCFS